VYEVEVQDPEACIYLESRLAPVWPTLYYDIPDLIYSYAKEPRQPLIVNQGSLSESELRMCLRVVNEYSNMTVERPYYNSTIR